ncbi:MAG: hypothetical protein IJ729_01240 [Alloprevotella sp.]|nr:hypothetical protein [Alloprevotella sp.]
MEKEKELQGGNPLPAQQEEAGGTPGAQQEGKKPYVPPRMQVIPLEPQRMLATSGGGGMHGTK